MLYFAEDESSKSQIVFAVNSEPYKETGGLNWEAVLRAIRRRFSCHRSSWESYRRRFTSLHDHLDRGNKYNKTAGACKMDRQSKNSGRFYNSEFGEGVNESNIEYRPAWIMYRHLEHLCKEKSYSLTEAVKEVAYKTGILSTRLHLIIGGSPPTSSELMKIIKALNWSPFFVFGIRENSYDEKQKMFFREIELENPTSKDQAAFKDLYAHCLFLKYEDEKEQNNG